MAKVFIIILFAAGSFPSIETAAQGAGNPAQARQAVERGLLPAFIPAGRTIGGWIITNRMVRYRVPGFSIALINDGRIEWFGGYGVTKTGTTNPVSGRTLFQAASLSKPVAAAGTLRLVQEGRLELNADVNSRLRSWRVPTNSYTCVQPVTLRGLLSHSAGVTVRGFPGYAAGEALPTLGQILEGAAPANSPPVTVDLLPGSASRYSGGGYVIVQQLIEDATGMPFAAAMRELVFEKAGMRRSVFEQPLSSRLKTEAAEAHDWKGTAVVGGWHTYPELAAAGLWTTSTDLARFLLGLRSAYLGRPEGLLEPMTARLMLSDVMDGTGLGVGVVGRGERLRFTHEGHNKGYRSYLVMYPETGDGLVAMANGDGGNDLIMEVVRAVARVYQWPDFAPDGRAVVSVVPAVLDACAGIYRFDGPGFTARIEREDDHLLLRTPRGSHYTFYPVGEGRFIAVEDGSVLTFPRGSQDGIDLHLWGFAARRMRP